VIDMEDFMHKLKSIKPWVIRKQELPLGAGEHRQFPNQIDDFRQFSQCINCMLCYAACPVYGLNSEFLGPAATALARRYNLDSRDQGLKERLPMISDAEGIWECSFVGECSVVCPKGVDPAKAIQQTKLATTMRFVLLFALYHSYTFLKLAGVIIRIKLFDRPIPSRAIVLAMFAAWAAASLVVGFVLIWFAR